MSEEIYRLKNILIEVRRVMFLKEYLLMPQVETTIISAVAALTGEIEDEFEQMRGSMII